MFEIKSTRKNETVTLECYYNNILQGNLVYNFETIEANLGIRKYCDTGTGMITLRTAIPETEFSEYNIAKKLCDEIKNKYNLSNIFTPETFGYKSYEAMLASEKFENMSKDELIETIINQENQLKNCY